MANSSCVQQPAEAGCSWGTKEGAPWARGHPSCTHSALWTYGLLTPTSLLLGPQQASALFCPKHQVGVGEQEWGAGRVESGLMDPLLGCPRLSLQRAELGTRPSLPCRLAPLTSGASLRGLLSPGAHRVPECARIPPQWKPAWPALSARSAGPPCHSLCKQGLRVWEEGGGRRCRQQGAATGTPGLPGLTTQQEGSREKTIQVRCLLLRQEWAVLMHGG